MQKPSSLLVHLLALVTVASLGQLVASAPSPGCADPTAKSDIKTDSMSKEELGDRDYLLYIPTRYEPTTPAPLILSYHGGSRDAEHQAALDQFNTTFFNKQYLVVYPNSVNGFWQGSPGVTSDDIGFTKDILDRVGEKFCVETERVYATGKSQGGGMAGALAADAELSTMIAAFAPVSGAFYVADDSKCDPVKVAIPNIPGRPDIPILEFHGEADEVIPYTGGGDRDDCLPSIYNWIQSWAKANGLDPDTNTTSKVKGAENDNATVFQFGEGASLGMVTHIMVGEDIGHDWPATVDNEDNLIQGHRRASFNASSVIIDFFDAHVITLPLAPSAGTTEGTTQTLTATDAGPIPITPTPSETSTKTESVSDLVTPTDSVSKATTTPSSSGTRSDPLHFGFMCALYSVGFLYIGSYAVF